MCYLIEKSLDLARNYEGILRTEGLLNFTFIEISIAITIRVWDGTSIGNRFEMTSLIIVDSLALKNYSFTSLTLSAGQDLY